MDDIFSQSGRVLMCIPVGPVNPSNPVRDDDHDIFRDMLNSDQYSYVSQWHPYRIGMSVDDAKPLLGKVKYLRSRSTVHPHPIVASLVTYDEAYNYKDGKDYPIDSRVRYMQSCLSILYQDLVNSRQRDYWSILSITKYIVFPIMISCKKFDLWFKAMLPVIVNFANQIESTMEVRVCIAAHRRLYDLIKHNGKMFDQTICEGNITKHIYLVNSLNDEEEDEIR